MGLNFDKQFTISCIIGGGLGIPCDSAYIVGIVFFSFACRIYGINVVYLQIKMKNFSI